MTVFYTNHNWKQWCTLTSNLLCQSIQYWESLGSIFSPVHTLHESSPTCPPFHPAVTWSSSYQCIKITLHLTCNILSGSFRATGMAIFDKSFPMFFFKMFHKLRWLVSGWGAGSWVRRPVCDRTWRFSFLPSSTVNERPQEEMMDIVTFSFKDGATKETIKLKPYPTPFHSFPTKDCYWGKWATE